MKRLIISLIFLFTGCSAYPQVEKRIVVEHFSNTQCPICFGKNPGLYQNLDHFPRIIHLSIFPGSPYPNCFLHLQNPLASDGRTNYYGVYGSTPRLVIQGDPQSFSVDFNDPSIFAPYEDQTSPFSMKISVG